ncbi:hypothetical protein C2S51_021501 [Perilla frutescens var. frutescens]|nr:hypothetical protein C2S51_021501 [Perilla frutescens var. frutescens]
MLRHKDLQEEVTDSASSSTSAGTQNDEPQQVEQAKSSLKKLLLEVIVEEMKMSSASSSSSDPALTGMQSKLEIHEGTRFTFVTPDLQEVTQQLDSAMEQVKLMAEHKISSTASSSSELLSVARSFICAAPKLCKKPSLLFCKLRLVRLLDVYEIWFREFPREIYQLVNLRYLAVTCESGGIPKGISRLLYLQTLIARVEFGSDVPSEVWEMSELRHIKLNTIICIEEGYMIKFVRKKLQTLCFVYVTPSLMRRGFFESIPNIKYLGVVFGDELASSSEVVDLTHLHKLQTLRFASQAGCRFLLIFPSSLRKLSLVNFVIFGRFMRTLCALPNLEVLKIGRCVFEDNEEWEAAEGDEFRSLQFLHLAGLDLWPQQNRFRSCSNLTTETTTSKF